MKIRHTDDYAMRRKNEYPTIEEQIEEIWRLLPVAALAESPIYQKICAIKGKFPKPGR